MNNSALENMGLNQKEVAVYLATLELGLATATDISAQAKIKRTTVQFLLTRMVQAGYLNITKKIRRKFYVAVPPDSIREMYKERLERFEAVIPELLAFTRSSPTRPKIIMYEGEDGIMKLYENQLRETKEIYAFVGVQSAQKKFRDRLFREHVAERLKKKAWAYVIAPDSAEGRDYQSADQNSMRKTKLISKEQYPFSVGIEIWANKVAIISYPKHESFAVLIESPEIAKSMRSIFQFFWSHLQ